MTPNLVCTVDIAVHFSAATNSFCMFSSKVKIVAHGAQFIRVAGFGLQQLARTSEIQRQFRGHRHTHVHRWQFETLGPSDIRCYCASKKRGVRPKPRKSEVPNLRKLRVRTYPKSSYHFESKGYATDVRSLVLVDLLVETIVFPFRDWSFILFILCSPCILGLG